MFFAQISDLHVVSDARRLYDFVDSNTLCSQAVAVLNGLNTPLDCVLVSGDTVNRGTRAAYAMLERILDGLRMPVFVIPGNHDDPGLLRELAGGAYHRAKGPKTDYVIEEYPLRILMIDTTDPGKLSGILSGDQLAWIDDEWANNPRETLLCMHHHPCPVGNAHMDPIRLANGEDLLNRIKKHNHVVGIACGHTHRAIFRHYESLPVFTAPGLATAIQTDRFDARGFFNPDEHAFMLHAFSPQYGLVSYVETLSAGRTYSFAHVNNNPKTGEA